MGIAEEKAELVAAQEKVKDRLVGWSDAEIAELVSDTAKNCLSRRGTFGLMPVSIFLVLALGPQDALEVTRSEEERIAAQTLWV